MTQEIEVIEPWYKQGWPWALIAIPFLTVIAGIITYQIAANNPHQMVQDNYYKKGLAINSDLELIDHAKDLKLTGTLSYDYESKLITLNLSADGIKYPLEKMKSKLFLSMSHPTISDLDQNLYLESVSQGELNTQGQTMVSSKEYLASFDNIEQAYWHISITDEDNTWQLKSRWLLPDTKRIEILPIR